MILNNMLSLKSKYGIYPLIIKLPSHCHQKQGQQTRTENRHHNTRIITTNQMQHRYKPKTHTRQPQPILHFFRATSSPTKQHLNFFSPEFSRKPSLWDLVPPGWAWNSSKNNWWLGCFPHVLRTIQEWFLKVMKVCLQDTPVIIIQKTDNRKHGRETRMFWTCLRGVGTPLVLYKKILQLGVGRYTPLVSINCTPLSLKKMTPPLSKLYAKNPQ